MPTKICTCCGYTKSIDSFCKDARDLRRGGIGRQNKCKSCEKQYREANKKIISSNKKKYYSKNSEKIKERSKSRYYNNREGILLKQKEYYDKNKVNWKKYGKKRRENMGDLEKFSLRVRQRISRSVKRKSDSSEKILGCDLAYFANYLGGFPSFNQHLDHIVPCSLADNKAESVALNHYSNFQLMNAKDNLKKGNRYVSRKSLKRVFKNHPNPNLIAEILQSKNINIK